MLERQVRAPITGPSPAHRGIGRFTKPYYPATYVRPISYRSPVLPAVVSGILGLLLVPTGVYLAAKYGFEAAAFQTANGRTAFGPVVLASFGGVLLLIAVCLNGWSAWATLVPGVVMTGVGGWAFENPNGFRTAAQWTQPLFDDNQLASWAPGGFHPARRDAAARGFSGTTIARRYS